MAFRLDKTIRAALTSLVAAASTVVVSKWPMLADLLGPENQAWIVGAAAVTLGSIVNYLLARLRKFVRDKWGVELSF